MSKIAVARSVGDDSCQRPSTLCINESQAIHVLDNRSLSSFMASENMAIDIWETYDVFGFLSNILLVPAK
jgi:hypothetical protein